MLSAVACLLFVGASQPVDEPTKSAIQQIFKLNTFSHFRNIIFELRNRATIRVGPVVPVWSSGRNLVFGVRAGVKQKFPGFKKFESESLFWSSNRDCLIFSQK